MIEQKWTTSGELSVSNQLTCWMSICSSWITSLRLVFLWRRGSSNLNKAVILTQTTYFCAWTKFRTVSMLGKGFHLQLSALILYHKRQKPPQTNVNLFLTKYSCFLILPSPSTFSKNTLMETRLMWNNAFLHVLHFIPPVSVPSCCTTEAPLAAHPGCWLRKWETGSLWPEYYNHTHKKMINQVTGFHPKYNQRHHKAKSRVDTVLLLQLTVWFS